MFTPIGSGINRQYFDGGIISKIDAWWVSYRGSRGRCQHYFCYTISTADRLYPLINRIVGLKKFTCSISQRPGPNVAVDIHILPRVGFRSVDPNTRTTVMIFLVLLKKKQTFPSHVPLKSHVGALGLTNSERIMTTPTRSEFVSAFVCVHRTRRLTLVLCGSSAVDENGRKVRLVTSPYGQTKNNDLRARVTIYKEAFPPWNTKKTTCSRFALPRLVMVSTFWFLNMAQIMPPNVAAPGSTNPEQPTTILREIFVNISYDVLLKYQNGNTYECQVRRVRTCTIAPPVLLYTSERTR